MLSCFSYVGLFVIVWTITHQATLSMEFSRQEYWIRLPFPSPGDLPDLGIEPASLMSLAVAGGFFTSATWEAPPPKKKTYRANNWIEQKFRIKDECANVSCIFMYWQWNRNWDKNPKPFIIESEILNSWNKSDEVLEICRLKTAKRCWDKLKMN